MVYHCFKLQLQIRFSPKFHLDIRDLLCFKLLFSAANVFVLFILTINSTIYYIFNNTLWYLMSCRLYQENLCTFSIFFESLIIHLYDFTQLRYRSQKFNGICRVLLGSNNDESEFILIEIQIFFCDIRWTFINFSFFLHLLENFKFSSLLLSQEFSKRSTKFVRRFDIKSKNSILKSWILI